MQEQFSAIDRRTIRALNLWGEFVVPPPKDLKPGKKALMMLGREYKEELIPPLTRFQKFLDFVRHRP